MHFAKRRWANRERAATMARDHGYQFIKKNRS
jgi:hypothetical protein